MKLISTLTRPATTAPNCWSVAITRRKLIPTAFRGGVINALRREVALAGLGQPHSLCRDDAGFIVLDSDGHRVIRFDCTGIRQQQSLTGFLRGIALCQGSLFIASSAGRVVSRKNPAVPKFQEVWDMAVEPVCIHELDAATLQIKARHFPLVAGFEIYDLLVLEGTEMVDPPRERLVAPNIHAMARAYYECAKRALAAIHHGHMATLPEDEPDSLRNAR